MPLSSSNAAKQLSDANSQGTCLGQSATDRISFYGSSTRQRLAGAVAMSTLTGSSVLATSVSAASGGGAVFTSQGFVYTSAAQANAVVTGINALQVDVTAMWNILRQLRGHAVSTGLFTGS